MFTDSLDFCCRYKTFSLEMNIAFLHIQYLQRFVHFGVFILLKGVKKLKPLTKQYEKKFWGKLYLPQTLIVGCPSLTTFFKLTLFCWDFPKHLISFPEVYIYFFHMLSLFLIEVIKYICIYSSRIVTYNVKMTKFVSYNSISLNKKQLFL